MRSLVALAIFATSSSFGFASFDMLLIGNNYLGNGESYKVTRYDPVNRVDLGSFGSGVLPDAVLDVAVDQASNTAYVLTATKIAMFDYNTGELKGAAESPVLGSRSIHFNRESSTVTFGPGDGGVLNNSPIYSQSLAFTGAFFVSAFQGHAPIQRSGSTNYFGFGATQVFGNNLQSAVWNPSGALINSGVTNIAFSGSNVLRDAAWSGTNLYGVSSVSGGPGTAIWLSSTTASTASAPIQQLTIHAAVPGIGASSARNIVAGHGGGLWIKTGNVFSSYHPVLGAGPTISLGAIGGVADLTGMAIVLAPEPGPIAVLCLGATYILKRRRG
ncbi:MAG: hypothetical protein K8R88_00300 [Armatimonadetes bacterium]|nr:hypothetical protein [Armatimonadota bacterium]